MRIEKYENFFENEEEMGDEFEMSQEEIQQEFLEKMLKREGELAKIIELHLRTRGMSLEYPIDVAEAGEEFTITYGSNSYDGALPNRISHYMEDLAEMIKDEIGVPVSWSFGPNHNCGMVTFYLDENIDPKYIRVKELIKY